MAWLPISYTVPQYMDTSVSPPQPASGYVLKAYQVGTTTPISMATTNEGTTTSGSIALNAQGYPEVSGNVVIPHLDQDYKLALYPDQTSADANSGAIWTVDDIDLIQTTDTSTAADYNVWPLKDYGGAYFDGSSDYLTRGAGLTGASDGKKGTIVAFVTFDNSASAIEYILHGTGAKFTLERTASGEIRVSAENAAGTTILDHKTSNTYETADTVYCIMSSWDLATPGSNQLYVNDTSDVATTTFTNDTIDYTVADWAVGADVGGSNKITGNVLYLWFDPTTNLDFDTEINRRKFLDEQDNPVFTGVHGELPTGSQPILFLGRYDETAFETNRGSGGDFTENGTMAAATVTFDGQYEFDRFPNVTSDVTATSTELNVLDGYTGTTTDLNNINLPSEGVFDATNGGSNDLTQIDFTGLASGARRITITFDNVSLTGNNDFLVQIGDSGGIESTGYSASSAQNTGSSTSRVTSTSGFIIDGLGAAIVISGVMILDLMDGSNNKWVSRSILNESGGGSLIDGAGIKSLTAELDRVRITVSGSETFDSGNINVRVET